MDNCFYSLSAIICLVCNILLSRLIRNNASQKIDNSTRNYIYTGYFTAIFGGVLGLVIGCDIMKKKRYYILAKGCFLIL